MKQRIFWTSLISAAVVFFGVQAAVAAERINTYDVSLRVYADASIDVQETIAYDFGDEDRHGIIRDIPVSYTAHGGKYNLRMSDIAVTDTHDISVPFTVSTQGVNKSIKIGDPDVLVSGEQTYRISYTIKRVLNFFDDHEELYWNAIGSEWEVPIGAASISVDTPAAGNVEYACYVGEMGTTTPCDISKTRGSELYFAHDHLAPHEAFTIVVSMPSGTVTKPTAMSSIKDFLVDNWAVGLPLLTTVVCFGLWYTRGRDPKGRGTIIPQYDIPEGLSPAQIGTIMDGKATNREFTAELIELARRGYLTLTREEEKKLLKDSVDYILTQTKAADASLVPYQKLILEKLFAHAEAKEGYDASTPGSFVQQSVRLSKLKQTFFEDFGAIMKSVAEDVTAHGYFKSNPTKTRGIYMVFGILVAFVSFFLMESSPLTGVCILISGIIIAVFGVFMPSVSEKGALVKEHILGLKMYLSVAEKDRLAFHNAPEKKPEQFEQFLPVAIALGVEKQWAKQFEGIEIKPPSWYRGANLAGWNVLVFTNQLNQFQTSAKHALATPAGKSGLGGGGFSGGGFGGGGGRSW